MIYCFVIITPTVAYANSGIPIVTSSLWGLFICFIPIVVIEIYYLHKKWLMSFKQLAKIVFIANLISTIIGFGLSLVVFSRLASGGHNITLRANVTPFHKVLAVLLEWGQAGGYWPTGAEKIWAVGMAIVLCFLPAFVVSWLSEYLIYFYSIKSLSRDRIRRDILIANLWSYLFLLLYAIYHVITYRFTPERYL